jgi:hypothetical protein
VLSEEDFDKVRPESTRVIDVVQFADDSAIDPMYIDRAYYLAPDGKMAGDAFAVMREGMKGKVGIGKLALYGRATRREAPTRVRTSDAEEDAGAVTANLSPKLRWPTAPRRTHQWPALGRPFRLIWTDAPRRWRAVEPNNSLTISRRLPPILTDHHPPRRSRNANVFGNIWSGREDLNLRPLGPEPSVLVKNSARFPRVGLPTGNQTGNRKRHLLEPVFQASAWDLRTI